MVKNELRTRYKKIRNEILNKEIKSNVITDKILDLDEYKSSNVICIYVSFSSEVITYNLIKKSLELGKTVAVPKIGNSNIMDFFIINSLDEFDSVNSLGIKEPKNNKKIDKNDIDLIIVPGICFDRNKNRVGFGKGYYDKYLCNLPDKTIKLGICFNEQILENEYIPCNKFDIKMDMIIFD